MIQAIADMMASILRPEGQIPQHWREVVIKVLHKTGDTDDAANYGPICIIAILY